MMLLNNPQRASQQVIFDGLNKGSMYPTDVDGAIDYDGLIFVFFELKHKGARVPVGQRRFFENVVNVLREGGGKAYAIICDHETDVNNPIYAANSVPRSYYDGYGWHTPLSEITLKSALRHILELEIENNPEYLERLQRFL